jgi:hypothetical protein
MITATEAFIDTIPLAKSQAKSGGIRENAQRFSLGADIVPATLRRPVMNVTIARAADYCAAERRGLA